MKATIRLSLLTLLLCIDFWSGTSVALAHSVGTVTAWGETSQHPVPTNLSGVTAIAAGRYHNLALKNDGSVLAWGYDQYGDATVPTNLSGVTAIAAGVYHSAALKNDGSVVAWGYNEYGETNVPIEAWSGVKAIAVGGYHTVALKDDGGVIAWGMTNYGQVTVPVAAESGVKAISAGPLQTMALKTDGTVLAWGQVFDGNNHVPAFVPPDLIGVTAIAAGYYHSAALKNNGTVVAWGNGSRGQTAVPAGLSNVTAIAVGYYHTVALKTDGTVVAWGDTQFSQTPAPAGMTGVVAIAAGDFHTLALVGDARWPGTLISLPNYSYDPEEGRQKITECRVNANGCFSLVFATHDTGAKCIISWTTTFHKWFPFFVFNANTVGSQIEEREPSGPVRFYRTTYLPHEVLPAEDFDYPMGNGGYDAGVDPVSADGIPEQITPERNTLYPSGPVGSPVREAVSPSTAWRNVQDVGAYYSVFGGLHPGEDWNNGSQSDADVGENVRAVANGQVVEIRSASVSGPSAGGYVMVIRHWLLNGDSVDSLYVHIAPDRNGGSANSGGLIGDESDFTYQVGAPVTKGSTIAVIGAVSAFSPHLHFEMRNKKLDVTGPLWPHSTGDAYYGPEVGSAGNRSPTISQADVEAAFGLMQADGIIDPSDFIDDHRP